MTNKSYQDKFTRYHDKPTINGESSSNNGWIYSAYSKYLLPDTLDDCKLIECASQCTRSLMPLKVDRSPNDLYPPFSKDEVIGMVSLGLKFSTNLEFSHWNFCNLKYEPKKLTLLSIFKAIMELHKIKKEIKKQKLEGGAARNYMWQNKRTAAYALGFWLQPWDQYYVRRFNGKSTSILQKIFFYLNFISTLTKGNKSVRMMLWLQLEDLKHPLLRLIPKKKYVEAYFDKDHPFRKNL